MGVQCFLPDCGHCSDHDKCKYYRIPKDLFEYYKWKNFLESVVNINEQLCSLLKLSQIMLLSFLCQSCTLFSMVLWGEFCVRNIFVHPKFDKGMITALYAMTTIWQQALPF